jgi:superfamily II DNA or RNA helicase
MITLVGNQVSGLKSPVRPYVDAATEAVVRDLTFDIKRPIKELGIVGCMFTESYSENRHHIPNIITPSFHSLTFRVKKAKPGAKVSFLVEFSLPKIGMTSKKRVSKRGTDQWQKYPGTARAVGEFHYRGWSKPGKPLEVELGESASGWISRAKEEEIESETSSSRETITIPELKLRYEITTTRLEGQVFTVTLIIRNQSSSNIRSVGGTIYGLSSEASTEGAAFVPIKVGGVEVPARARNTHVRMNGDILVASPVAILDVPRLDPVQGPEFSRLSTPRGLLTELTAIAPADRQKLQDSGELEAIALILASMSEALPHVKYLYAWQFDAIQRIIARRSEGDSTPFILRAPTGKGKTLVFAFASLLTALLSNSEGTKVVLTFPTRALTAQQLNEFVAMLYRLNLKAGKKVRVALYMGRGGTLGSVIPKYITEGDPLPHITRCPECHEKEVVAHKPDDDSVVPKCSKCGTQLDFVALSDSAAEQKPPDILIATVDKLAYEISQSFFSYTLFGAESRVCGSCGTWHLKSFAKYAGEDAVCRKCGATLPVKTSRSSIGLLVFDEVHSLYATTGNLTAHFISLLKRLNVEFGNGDISVIGATATVANESALLQNLVDSKPEVFPSEEGFAKYFVQHDELQYRFVVTEPLDRATRSLVSRGIGAYDGFLRDVKSTASEEMKALVAKLKQSNPDFVSKYEQQFVFVNRKKDGSTLQKTITETFAAPPETAFVSGDDSSRQLALKSKAVIEHRTTVVIATKIYSLGMDFGDLNVLQFFGVPDTIVDLVQIIGRIGRTGLPALVFLHLYPPNPRDNFVYEFFDQIMAKPGVHFEPTPINALNRYAIYQSSLNIILGLILARSDKVPSVRYCDKAYQYYVKEKNAEALMDDVVGVYKRSFASAQEMADIRSIVRERLKFLFSSCQGKNGDIVGMLKDKGLLLTSLRGESRYVEYSPTIQYQVMDSIEVDNEAEDSALIDVSRAEETPPESGEGGSGEVKA